MKNGTEYTQYRVNLPRKLVEDKLKWNKVEEVSITLEGKKLIYHLEELEKE